ncbi:MAG: hypothetical protein IT382_07835 [Deltaproteobacteria bacterium]|nr:hypothetical protein [Deltaproteobacteria bacterium]
MSDTERYLGVAAGPYSLALPLLTVRQILDVGGSSSMAPTDPRALGVAPISLAGLMDKPPLPGRPGLLLVDGHSGPVLLSVCGVSGVFDAPPPLPLPKTVACRWPGLVRGVLGSAAGQRRLVLDPRVLMGLVEAAEARA